MFVYHIVLPEVWENFKDRASYTANSLAAEGFIHCSYASQLADVLNRYYSNAGKVLILKLDTSKLTSKLVEESSTNEEIYPHIYGPINLDAVVEVEEQEIR
jgi:uncharacterized protein (DUF952 family)